MASPGVGWDGAARGETNWCAPALERARWLAEKAEPKRAPGDPGAEAGAGPIVQRRRLAHIALAAAAGATLAPSGAVAHAMLHASEPADGSRVTASPRAVTLTFMEPCRVTAMRLLNGAGQESPLRRGAARSAATTASAAVPNPLPPGDYRVEWRAIGADGHVMSGAVRFAVAAL